MNVPPKRLQVRPATVGERRAVADLWIKTGLTTVYNDPDVDFVFAHEKPASTVLVGLLGGKIIASVMVGHDGHRGWLYYVSVDPDEQKAGHGAAIVAAGENWLKQGCAQGVATHPEYERGRGKLLQADRV